VEQPPETHRIDSPTRTISDTLAPVGLSAVLATPAQLSSQPFDWHGVLVERRQYPPIALPPTSFSEHILTVHLGRPTFKSQVVDGRAHEAAMVKGSIILAPADYRYTTCWSQAIESLHVFLAPQLMAVIALEALELNPDRVELSHQFGIHNPRVADIALLLMHELENGALASRLYAESLTNVLAVQLLRQYSTQRRRLPNPDHLSAPRLRSVVDYIDAHLQHNLTLDELAQHTGFSAYHFTRLFKQATGLAPHQFVIRRRIERAKQLLRYSDLSLAAIAHDVGFSSHSHFTTLFRRAVGITPSTYRAAQ